MLSVLKIKNIAIIESAEIEFSQGFNVLTGETGAGKSIILDSINTILGYRTSRELIRTGESQAEVSALFSFVKPEVVLKLREMGIDAEDGTLVVSRIITPDKNICRINGTLVNVSLLKEIGSYLINIHGQQDNRDLLNAETHLSYVDAVSETESLLLDFRETYSRLSELKSEIKRLTVDKNERARKIDMLKYQIDELEKADIIVGEWQELKRKQSEILNYEKIQSAFNNAYNILAGDGDCAGVVQLLSSLTREINSVRNVSEDAREICETVSDIYYTLSDISETVREKSEDASFSPLVLSEIEDRLDLLYRLSKKYGDTEEEMLNYLSNAYLELSSIEDSDGKLEELTAEKEKTEKTALQKASALSKKRRLAAEAFSVKVCSELGFLDMPSVRFFVNFTDVPLCENGIDNAEFFISANIGEEPKPLAKISSGGELSRIMLALKTVIADKDKVSSMVFDEIDTGVSGRAAMKIASKLKQVSEDKQVICVTHLAQIASAANTHFLIEKSSDNSKTYTKVTRLSKEERVYEIARIIGGGDVTLSQLQSAEELLQG